jgi:DNA-binding transcriptional regulator PaaX
MGLMSNSFCMVNPSFLVELAKDRRFGGAEFRVLYTLLGLIGAEGSVQISQADIGKMIGMKQQSVFVAMKTLTKAGVLRSERKSGQTATYVINPYYGVRDKASNVFQMQRAWDGDH